MSESGTGEKEKLSSKVLSGIADSGKKVASGGGSVVSGIKSSTGKVASSGSKAISGIASTGSKAVHSITSPIGSAVRHTVDKANNSLHGNSSHDSTSSAQEASSGSEVKAEDTKGKGAADDMPTAASVSETSLAEGPPVQPASRAPPKPEVTAIVHAIDDDSSHGVLGSMEAVTNKLLVNPVRGAAGLVAEGGNKLLITPAKATAHKVSAGSKEFTERSKEFLHIKSKDSSRDMDEDEHEDDLPDVPPDDTLKKMNVIINKRLKDVSIPDYYAIAWSEGDRTDKAPLYGPWLKDSGKQDINVGTWDFADDGNEFVGDWDGEKYSQQRTVTFVFNKQIPFKPGPTLAKVKHTQYCRVEGRDKCVLAMTVEMTGVPYSDCFNVVIRWVATRSGKNDIAIQVGLYVNFIKSTVMANKIRSGTTDQTTQAQVQLFRAIKQACGAVSEEVISPEKETVDDMPGQFSCTSWLSNVLPFMHTDALADRNDEVAVSAKSADTKMKKVMTKLSDSEPSETDPEVLTQLVVVNDALDKILST